MELINTSPVPVDFEIVGKLPDDSRALILTAKATFKIEENGQVKLDREAQLPLLNEDQTTELGLQPRDNLPRLDPAFEVMLLGRAHAPGGQTTSRMTVALSVGDIHHEIDVIGERVWQGEGSSASISSPEVFETMPLVWERAFGGSQQVLIDREAILDVSSPINSEGKGFDHISQARELGDAFMCPEGYPQFDTTRPLPNLEMPGSHVTSWSDAPLPVCWAPVPLSSGLIFERFTRSCERRGEDYIRLGAPEMLHRAHPDWVIGTPGAGAAIRLEGTSREGLLEFRLPELRVVADFQDGKKVQALELFPRSLVLLPEVKRFFLTFRCVTGFESKENEKRIARIRLLKGWCPDKTESE